MAQFTDAQITSLAEILGTSSNVLNAHLGYVGSLITETDKTSILNRVTEYQAVEDNDVSISPMERNFGARIDNSKKRSLIKNRIASLLLWETNEGRLVRS